MTKANMQQMLLAANSPFYAIQILDIEKLEMTGKGTEDVYALSVYRHGVFSLVEVYVANNKIVHTEQVA